MARALLVPSRIKPAAGVCLGDQIHTHTGRGRGRQTAMSGTGWRVLRKGRLETVGMWGERSRVSDKTRRGAAHFATNPAASV